MTNGTDPNTMTAEERMAEVSMLLSLAMMRLWRKHRASAGSQRAGSRNSSRVGQDCLELPGDPSPDGPVQLRKEFSE